MAFGQKLREEDAPKAAKVAFEANSYMGEPRSDKNPKLLRFLSYVADIDSKKFDRGEDYKEIQQYQLAQDMNTMIDVEKVQEKLSVYKAQLPLPRLFFLGVLAGWWVGLAVILVVTIAGGIPVDTRAAWPCLAKLVSGIFFPVAIFLIVIFGGELFTGNAMSMLVGLFSGRVTLAELLYNWIVVLVSNFAGCVFTVYMFGRLTNLFVDEPWASYTKGVAVYKIHLLPEVAFLRAIPANALVCTSVLIGLQARNMTGKLVRRPPPPARRNTRARAQIRILSPWNAPVSAIVRRG